jgi:hypothetical protein
VLKIGKNNPAKDENGLHKNIAFYLLNEKGFSGFFRIFTNSK